MFKNIIEQFVFFPVKGLEKTPELLNLHYNNVYINYQDNKIHGWYIIKYNSIGSKIVFIKHQIPNIIQNYTIHHVHASLNLRQPVYFIVKINNNSRQFQRN